MAEDLLAFLADGPWQSLQMAEDLLAFSADGPWQSRQMAEDLLAFSADGPGFLGIWSRVSWQMAKNLSIVTSFPSPVDLRDKRTTSPKGGKRISTS